jgi:hypothetical protein
MAFQRFLRLHEKKDISRMKEKSPEERDEGRKGKKNVLKFHEWNL